MQSLCDVVVLGAGHIGQSVANTLHDSGDYRVTVIDNNQSALHSLSLRSIATLHLDINNSSLLANALKGARIVANALPHYCALQIATIAKEQGCHYFDLTEDVAATKGIRALAKGADTAFMPQCGLAPGFIGIAAHALALKFDRLIDLKMRVGALPIYPTNSIKYNLTWSVDGLINEYCQPCEALKSGAYVTLPPMEGLESLCVDGIEYEAFNTSGGLSTICETLAGRVENIDYKTIRYPGHCAIMKILLNEFRLSESKEMLRHIMVNSIPSTNQDVVIILVIGTGYIEGRLVELVHSTKVIASAKASAIQITTVAGICAAIDMFCNKQLPQQGFIRQEDISLGTFLSNRFGCVYDNSTVVSASNTLKMHDLNAESAAGL